MGVSVAVFTGLKFKLIGENASSWHQRVVTHKISKKGKDNGRSIPRNVASLK